MAASIQPVGCIVQPTGCIVQPLLCRPRTHCLCSRPPTKCGTKPESSTTTRSRANYLENSFRDTVCYPEKGGDLGNGRILFGRSCCATQQQMHILQRGTQSPSTTTAQCAIFNCFYWNTCSQESQHQTTHRQKAQIRNDVLFVGGAPTGIARRVMCHCMYKDNVGTHTTVNSLR